MIIANPHITKLIFKVNFHQLIELMLSLSHLKNKRWSLRVWNGCTIHFSKMWHEIQTAAVTKSFKWSFLLIKWLQISPEISIYPKTSGRWTLCHIAPLLKEDCNPLKNCVKIQPITTANTLTGQKQNIWLYSKTAWCYWSS